MSILLTGATGTIGRRLVHRLSSDGVRPRAVVRDPRRATALLGDLADYVRGDLSDPSSLSAAMTGVETVFLLSPNHPDQVRHELAVIDAAAAAGVSRLVKMSARGAHHTASNAFWRGHARIEEHLAALGLPAVVLRPSFLMTNLLAGAQTVRQHGVLMAPAGQARIAMIDPTDVAAVATVALLDSELTPQVLELTGPQGVTHDEVAATLGSVTSRAVTYVPVAPQDATAGLVGAGLPEQFAQEVVRVYESLRRGDQESTTDVVARVTGRPARSLAGFLHDHVDSFSMRDAG
ncbi:SDR family oxidoreductase [Oryzobacter terrae]|uniref:SDR family oxidoreductase n=1 Tax=Oryzobacter terrae TaxID=1620385 RepID=UPI00366DDD05